MAPPSSAKGGRPQSARGEGRLNLDLAADLDDMVVRKVERVADAGRVAAHRVEQRGLPPRQTFAVLARYDRLMPDVIGDVVEVDVRVLGPALRQYELDVGYFHEAHLHLGAPEIFGFLRQRDALSTVHARLGDDRH